MIYQAKHISSLEHACLRVNCEPETDNKSIARLDFVWFLRMEI